MLEMWIPSGKAIKLFAQRYDASKRYADFQVALEVAEEAMLNRLSSGALRARTAKGYMNSGEPFGMENESHFEDECLPAAFWWALRASELRDRSLDWVLGDFSYSSGYNESSASGRAFDVHFDANGIPGAAPHADEVNAEKTCQIGREGQRNVIGRKRFWQFSAKSTGAI